MENSSQRPSKLAQRGWIGSCAVSRTMRTIVTLGTASEAFEILEHITQVTVGDSLMPFDLQNNS
jgi:hypothetical protein